MIWVIWAGLILAALVIGVLLEDARRDRTRKVRHREYVSAVTALNTIDSIVDTNYMTTDLVGQAICDEIRRVIHEHRKDNTSR